MPDSLRSPIFILGCHKSGSSLIRALLDGHPDLAVLPREAHPLQFAGYWSSYLLRAPLPHSKGQTLKDYMQAGLINEAVADSAYSDAPGAAMYDPAVVARLGNANDGGELVSRYLRLLYEQRTGHSLASETRIVEKSVENAEFAGLLRRWFPDASFIHIVRNPYATILALRRAKSTPRSPFMGRIAVSLKSSYQSLYLNPQILDGYHVIRYEDLVNNPVDTMQSLAKSLDIRYHKSLETPTSLGKPWAGNSTSNQGFQGVSTAPLNAWRTMIGDYEIALTNRIAGPIIEQYHYKRMAARRPWRPMPRESPRRYIANRLLLKLWNDNCWFPLPSPIGPDHECLKG